MLNSCGSVYNAREMGPRYTERKVLYHAFFAQPVKTGNRVESYCKTIFQVVALCQNECLT